jgi:hypothetical protein
MRIPGYVLKPFYDSGISLTRKGRRAKMKRLGLLLGVFLCVAGLSAAQTKNELQQMYMDYLKEQGYVPSLDSDGDVSFKIEGRGYYIIIDESDPTYFLILYPNFWEIESEEERQKASAVIMNVNRTTKVAKAYITSLDNTCIETAILLNTPNDFSRHFSRMISMTQTARRQFIDGMNE